MTDLPAPLTEPLHILEPWPWREALVVLLLGAAALWLFWRWLRAARNRKRPRPPAVPGSALSEFTAAVEGVRARAHQAGSFRSGCHELAELLRLRLRLRHGGSVDFLTAREATARLGESGVTLLLREIADLRFARTPPNARVFDRLCDRTLELEAGSS